MTMDIKNIIKWFIPCFHILLSRNFSKKWVLVCLVLFVNLVESSKLNSELGLNNKLDSTKNVELSSVSYEENKKNNGSDGFTEKTFQIEKPRSLGDTTVGRTFGRPFVKKAIAGLMPIIFQIGAMSTWAVIGTLVGFKTLLVTLLILKLLLVTGAAKLGALFASKGHQSHSHWEPPHQKEIHLHIHNGGHEQHHEEHSPYSYWNREGYSTPESNPGYAKPVYAYQPSRSSGPETISTPYGNYIKID